MALLLVGDPAEAEEASQELIVLLRGGEGALSPEAVVSAINEGSSGLSASFLAGAPEAAWTLLSYRAEGPFKDWLLAHPDHPRARLERYVVIRYGDALNRAFAETALAADPNVLSAGPNGTMPSSSSPPADPLLCGDGSCTGGDPLSHQWGFLPVNLFNAWDLTTGHAYIGIPDSGIDGQIAECDIPGPTQGLETGHPDLRVFDETGGSAVYDGGNWRPALSRDLGNVATRPVPGELEFRDFCVDEGEHEPQAGQQDSVRRPADLGGHGTHVAGIIAATTDNGLGVAGSSWHSSLMVARTAHLKFQGLPGNDFIILPISDNSDIVEAITWLTDKGAQVINMSFGRLRVFDTPTSAIITCFPIPPAEISPSYVVYCDALAYAYEREVLMVAASGNKREPVNFPARDPRVVAVGGLEHPGVFWDDGADCFGTGSDEGCGTNFGAEQELAAPAKEVLSTIYRGFTWSTVAGCSDGNFAAADDGFGRCTGTSMSAPHVVGIAGLLRSANPLLSSETVRSMLWDHASQAGSPTPQLGYGVPDARASVAAVLGVSGGVTLPNRLTPLFSLYSSLAVDHLYSTVPQMAMAAIYATDDPPYTSQGPALAFYPNFPVPCVFSPCDFAIPRASVSLFTAEHNPLAGGAPLVPLYRLVWRAEAGSDRSHFYTTQTSGITAARAAGYQLEGIEGYVYPTCGTSPCAANPGCNPPGSTPLHRRYHPGLDDYALFPESERAAYEAQGYTVVPSGQAACLGYVYPNQDADGDHLVDGFETLAGTDPLEPDSDCDGASDGSEVLSFPYGDPKSAPGCLLFQDGFESSTIGAWGTSATTAGSSLLVSGKQPLVGSYSLRSELDGNAGSLAFVRDNTPASEARYRARFYLKAEDLAMADGSQHYVFIAQGSIGVLRVALRTRAGVRSVKLFAYHDDGSGTGSAWLPMTGTTALEVDWKAASGSGLANGYAKLWFGGTLVATLPNLDNDTLRVDHVSLGAVNGVDAGTAGYLVVDAFESRKATYIGLEP